MPSASARTKTSYPSELSGGQQQRRRIRTRACAFAPSHHLGRADRLARRCGRPHGHAAPGDHALKPDRAVIIVATQTAVSSHSPTASSACPTAASRTSSCRLSRRRTDVPPLETHHLWFAASRHSRRSAAIGSITRHQPVKQSVAPITSPPVQPASLAITRGRGFVGAAGIVEPAGEQLHRRARIGHRQQGARRAGQEGQGRRRPFCYRRARGGGSSLDTSNRACCRGAPPRADACPHTVAHRHPRCRPRRGRRPEGRDGGLAGPITDRRMR